MSLLPLDAPFLAIERLSVNGDCVNSFDQAATRHIRLLEDSYTYRVVCGWRVDAAAESHEALLFTGWENAHAHVSFAARQHDLGVGEATCDGQYKELSVHHTWNLEREEAQQQSLA
jgi:hypothetical protein